jgi:hypothetical protein
MGPSELMSFALLQRWPGFWLRPVSGAWQCWLTGRFFLVASARNAPVNETPRDAVGQLGLSADLTVLGRRYITSTVFEITIHPPVGPDWTNALQREVLCANC